MRGDIIFAGLFDFALNRNVKQSIGFYIVHLLITLALGALAGMVAEIIFSTEQAVMWAGNIVGTVYLLFLYIKIYFAKNLKETKYLILGIINFLVSLVLGGIVALIIVAYLTTVEKSS